MKTRSGEIDYIYRDIENIYEIDQSKARVVHAFCFYGDKLVICHSPSKGEKYWTIPGGSIESGETIDQAVIREIKEETNMKVLKHKFLGYIEFIDLDKKIPTIQTRSVCIVEPYGEFVTDPDDDITEIKLIDPQDLSQYLNWGEIGEWMVKRAVEFKNYV